MEAFALGRDEAIAGLRTMREVARADENESEIEDLLLDAAAETLGLDVRHAELRTITPEEAATLVKDATARRRLVQAMIVMAIADGEATEREANVIDRFAAALGVDEPHTRNVHRLVEKQFLRLRFDVLRRFPTVRDMVRETVKKHGWFGMVKTAAILRGFAHDESLAFRFKRLGLLPEGTLGRTFWAQMTEWGFALPGEPHGLNEYSVHHDLTHVLGGYGTDAAGEIQVAAFSAGYKKEDPFGLVFGTLLSFQVGARIHPLAEPSQGKLDVKKAVRAFERGMAMNKDLSADWDYWPLFARPIDEVRRELGIPPMER